MSALRAEIERLDSASIAHKIEKGYYSDEALEIARSVLESRGVSTVEEIASLGRLEQQNLDTEKKQKRGKVYAILWLIIAPYLYWGLASDVARLSVGSDWRELIGVTFIVIYLYSVYELYRFTYRRLGVYNPVLFFAAFSVTSIFIGLALKIVSSLFL
jgi:hypothetical protein